MLETENLPSQIAVSPKYQFSQRVSVVAGLPNRTALTYLLLFIVGFGFYSTVWRTVPIIEPDSTSYMREAQDLSDFHIDQLHERTPGYPLFLLLTGSSESPKRSLFFVSLILHFASIWLLGSILYRTGLSHMKLSLFGFLLVLPPFVESAGYVLTENLTETMLVASFASFVFWVRKKRMIWLWMSAACVAFAALTRPTYQILALAIVVYLVGVRTLLPRIVTWRQIVTASAVLFAGSLVLVGGYSYSNYRKFGYFGITYKLGISLSQKTVHVLDRLPDEYATVRDVLIKERNSDLLSGAGPASVGYISSAVPELVRVTGLGEVELSKYMLKLNLLLIRKAPLNYLREVAWAFGSYSFPTASNLANFNSRFILFVWASLHFFLIAAFAYTVFALGGAAMFARQFKSLGKQRNRTKSEQIDSLTFLYGLAGMIVVYTAAISCFIDAGDPRHRVPTDILIVFMVFLGSQLWHQLVDSFRTALQNKQVGPTFCNRSLTWWRR